jgi:hypothetical protein
MNRHQLYARTPPAHTPHSCTTDVQLHIDLKSRPSVNHRDQIWHRRRRARHIPFVIPREKGCKFILGSQPGAKTRAEQSSNAGGGRSTERASPIELRLVRRCSFFFFWTASLKLCRSPICWIPAHRHLLLIHGSCLRLIHENILNKIFFPDSSAPSHSEVSVALSYRIFCFFK